MSDTWFSDLGIPIGAPNTADDFTDRGRGDLRGFAMGSLAAQDNYIPSSGFPEYRAPRQNLPEVQALIGDGGQFSAGYPAADRAADAAGRLAFDALVPQTPLDIGLTAAFGPGGKLLRGAAAGAGYLLDSDEALADKGSKIAKSGKKVIERMGEILSPTAAEIPTLGETSPMLSEAARFIRDPIRVANPGVYKRPDVIAAEGAATVAPEHPALKALFGVTRDDLYEISKQGKREGNIREPNIWSPTRPGKVNEAAAAAMSDANAQRIVDTLAEAQRYPDLIKGMVPWYVMDPAYEQMVRLVGPERAAKEYRDFNMSMTPFSAGSPVPLEINRGTAARMMWNAGEYEAFKKYGGLAGKNRGEDFPEALRDVKGVMGHLNMANPVESYMTTGKHGYGNDSVKINLYSDASGVPEIGFQTRWAVPDAHFTRAVGLPEVRTNAGFNDYMSGTEYRPIGPWYREKVAEPLGIEAVPAQALMWGTYGPQTGVKTKIGAGKLELLSANIWDRARMLGVDPRQLRDEVLTGKSHASWLLPALMGGGGAMGSLARQDEYQ